MAQVLAKSRSSLNRRYFIGGSEARIIMGDDEAALVRLWREKRGDIEREDLSDNLVVQLGLVTEAEPALVSGQFRPDHYRRSAPDPASGTALDGRHAGRPGRSDRRGVRGQVHAALVFLGRSRGREIHAATAAQYVGGGGQERCALGHHPRPQLGRDHTPCPSPPPASHRNRGAEVLALRRER